MNNKTEFVLRGFVELTPHEQDDFIEAVNRYLKLPPIDKQTIRDNIRRKKRQDSGQRVGLGPLGNSPCPCCGK